MTDAVEKKYPVAEGLTVVWRPERCMHARHCWKELPAVFDPQKRPWVDVKGANPDAIAAQVRRCPSGALSLEGDAEPTPAEPLTVEVSADGPLLINGPVRVKGADGQVRALNKTALCRCGGSANKPFCDGAHRRNGFKG